MTIRDLVEISTGNLWRMKLRATLTIFGVVIAIAAFVSMLSFGAGMQENVRMQFEKFGLFNTILVYPGDKAEDSTTVIILNDSIVSEFSKMPGVSFAYPYDDFKVEVSFNDTNYSSKAQVIPVVALNSKLFSDMEAGNVISSDSANEVVVTERFLEELGDSVLGDSLIGKEIIVSVSVASVDSGITRLFDFDRELIKNRVKEFDFDSLNNRDYIKRIAGEEAGSALMRFINGYMNSRAMISDTLTIVGTLDHPGGRSRIRPLIIPKRTGEKFSNAGFSGDPTELFSSLKSGTLFGSSKNSFSGYSRITINIDPNYSYKIANDSLIELGFETFSYAEEFDEIRQIFLYFNMVLGLVGFIALITASLGIVNTMIMSIMERRKEIGILKSLGADPSEIRYLFLVESALIGSIGAILGIFIGWLITRLASVIARSYMVEHGVDEIELFYLPVWLILIAFGFGLIVSLGAGYFPSARASKVDPVEALRSE